MLGLPKSTVVDINLPKKKFYENLSVSPKLKRHFIDEIDGIRWQNKISPETMNISAGEKVQEIEVIEIRLAHESIDEKVLTQIDREIPYHLLYVFTKGKKAKLCIGYKEYAQSGSNTFKVSRYFYNDWSDLEQLPISIEATDLDSVYDRLIRFIAGDSLVDNSSVFDSIEQLKKKEKLQKQIDKLDKQLKLEKQLNKQFELRDRINSLRQQL